jgi:hypothetical protein
MVDRGLMAIAVEGIGEGRFLDEANAQLGKMTDDMIARSTVYGTWTVTSETTITRDPENPDNPMVDWTVKWKCPGAKGMASRAFLDRDTGTLLISRHGIDARQRTLHDVEGFEGKVDVTPIRNGKKAQT